MRTSKLAVGSTNMPTETGDSKDGLGLGGDSTSGTTGEASTLGELFATEGTVREPSKDASFDAGARSRFDEVSDLVAGAASVLRVETELTVLSGKIGPGVGA